ncbi:MAG: hypothetical protein A3C35_07330 [Omnitrophica bacterium RIFCSPHIGHO2_02_FULL_46_11]|nr:MAG: hypothetical protein A3C35_07330 [Omnitrophica bacterium RIFCSPHIGHO2_02_FULL_46_11]
MGKQYYFAVLCLALILSACTSVHAPSGFLGDYSHFSEEKGEHFRQEYVAEGVDLTKYTKAKVNPVELKYFENAAGTFTEDDSNYLASRLQESLEAELANKYQVLGPAERPDERTLVVSPALVYVKMPERLLNVATALLIGFQFSKGAAAFEAKLTDGGSGKELALVTEQRKSGGGIKDIKSILIGGFFKFMHAEGAFKRWGQNFVDLGTPESTS